MICIAKPPSPQNTMPGYCIPQKAYDIAIHVPMEIANEYDLDPKVRLSAVKEIRTTIDHHYEIRWFDEQRKALKEMDNAGAVIVIEDETFFDNDAHAQAKTMDQETSQQKQSTAEDPPP